MAGERLVVDVGRLAWRYDGYRSLLRYVLFGLFIVLGAIFTPVTLMILAGLVSTLGTGGAEFWGGLALAFIILAMFALPLWMVSAAVGRFAEHLSRLERRGVGALQVLLFALLALNIVGLTFAIVDSIAVVVTFWPPRLRMYEMVSHVSTIYMVMAFAALCSVLWAYITLPRLGEFARAMLAESAVGDTARASLSQVTGLPAQINSKLTGFDPPPLMAFLARSAQFMSSFFTGVYLIPLALTGLVAVAYYVAPAIVPYQILAGLTLFFMSVLLVAIVASVIARALSIAAFRATLRSTATLDERFPVLFLRSFKDDQARFRSSPLIEPWRQMTVGFEPDNLDQLLVEEALGYGPVVALGKPGEGDPPLGAKRAYVHHQGWQDTATSLMVGSRALVIVLDDTPGTRWEIDAITQSPLMEKTLFLLPPSRGKQQWLSEIAALKLFDEDENVIGFWRSKDVMWVFRARRRSCAAYRLALRTFLRASAGDPRLSPHAIQETDGRYIQMRAA